MPIEPPDTTSFRGALGEVVRIAAPLMISTGLFSLTLFADRTLLLWYDGSSMAASMAAGNLFWVLICLPVGLMSMTGAIVSQYVGSNREADIGRFLWQSVWLSLAFLPWFGWLGWSAEDLFRWTGQPRELIAAEATYFRLLMFAAVGSVIESALSGFFSGTSRTAVIAYVSIVSALINLAGDYLLIFGVGPDDALWIPAMGVAGAAVASGASFVFKAVAYATLLLAVPAWRRRYRILNGFGFDLGMVRKLIFYGLPAGLMFVAESGTFTAICLRIGTLGDLPLRATTMAINFNMIAFIPLVGVSIAASVCVGRRLTAYGPESAVAAARASLAIAVVYSGIWAIVYATLPDRLAAFYRWGGTTDPLTEPAIASAVGLFSFVAAYIVADSLNLVAAGVLRGAGDTWFVLSAGVACGAAAIGLGVAFEPGVSGAGVASGDAASADRRLIWWWTIILVWIWSLGITMLAGYFSGRWKNKRMVEA